MAKLIANCAGQAEIEHDLQGETRIGRASTCELALSGNQPSREHVLITQQSGVWTVEDLKSTNGTRHNDVALPPGMHRALVSGDRLTIGEWEVTFIDEDDSTPLPESDEPPTATFAVRAEQIIGRDTGCHIVLDHPNVSRRHCRIYETPKGWEIEDLGSRNGTYLNDVRLARRETLRTGDEVRIGMALFVFRKDRLELFDQKRSVRIDTVGLGVTVRKENKPLALLQNITLVIEPRQFVAVVGASGAGKSTLLNALTGFRKADTGSVLINGADYYANLELFRASIGYVPQDDIIHRELTVADVLRYAAHLRLPPDTGRDEVERLVDDTLKELKLTHRKRAIVSTLSGGERKRVNIGVELLTKPSLLFLDEPTTGLDPLAILKFVELMQQLAHEGRTIVMISHETASIAACDRLLFLARGGRIAYYGPPAEALTYFEVDDYAKIYEKVNEGGNPPEFWEEKFRNSPEHLRYIATPQKSRPDHKKGKTIHVARNIGATAPRPSALQQLGILLPRYLATLRGDLRNVGFLFAQAPAIALLLLTVFPSTLFTGKSPAQQADFLQRAPILIFCIVISALLFGIVNSCRELTKERPIFRRERLVNLRIWPYLASKVVALAALSAAQSVVLLCLIRLKIDFGVDASHFLQMIGVVCLTAWSGLLLGFVLSALAATNDQAMSLVPIAVLPQIIFSGLIEIENIPVVSKVMPSYWAYAALGHLSNLKGKDLFTQSPSQACFYLASISIAYLLLCYQLLKTRDKQVP